MDIFSDIDAPKLRNGINRIPRNEPATRTTLKIDPNLESKLDKAADLFNKSEKQLLSLIFSMFREELESNPNSIEKIALLDMSPMNLQKRKTIYLSKKTNLDLDAVSKLLATDRSTSFWIACETILFTVSDGCRDCLRDLEGAKTTLEQIVAVTGYKEIAAWKQEFDWIDWRTYSNFSDPKELHDCIKGMTEALDREIETERKLIELLSPGESSQAAEGGIA